MLSQELLKKVRMIEIVSRKRISDLMSGQYRSHFKGHGVQFSEHRIYVPGDDVRHMDWKVSARTRDPLIKKFEEERELSVLLIVDGSGSQFFGSKKYLKSEITASVSGMLAYAATHTGDKVGVIFFGGKVEKIIPPKKGRQHVLRIIRDVLTYRPQTPGTHLAAALEAACRLLKQSGVVFILSDFMAENFDMPLKRLCRRHDVVAISIEDEREEHVPSLGRVLLRDLEAGVEKIVDTSSFMFQKWFQDFRATQIKNRKSLLKGRKLEFLSIKTEDGFDDVLIRFFKTRARSQRL